MRKYYRKARKGLDKAHATVLQLTKLPIRRTKELVFFEATLGNPTNASYPLYMQQLIVIL
jgi:hypothetical protein